LSETTPLNYELTITEVWVMASATEIRQKAILFSRRFANALIGQLPQDKLMAVVQLLEFLAEPPQPSTVSAQEAQLLEAIENHLPEEEQVRLDTLRDQLCWCAPRNRSRWDKLSEAEHQELIGYEDLLEQQRVERGGR
jgi:hypothetical protein